MKKYTVIKWYLKIFGIVKMNLSMPYNEFIATCIGWAIIAMAFYLGCCGIAKVIGSFAPHGFF